MTRASGFGATPDYLTKAHEDICLIFQIENRAGLEAIEDIAALPGVDAIFIGPSDLAGALGHLGNAGHPDVQGAIAQAFQAVRRVGKPVGIFATSVESAKRYVAAGAGLVSVGSDIGLLSNGAKALQRAIVT